MLQKLLLVFKRGIDQLNFVFEKKPGLLYKNMILVLMGLVEYIFTNGKEWPNLFTRWLIIINAYKLLFRI